ncbi:MAG TPA: hypothetical protein VHE35_23990 [Kofleriaceae bacterium]|nr:hypothetical protein [Kofleriaceae bacterium]
MTVAGPTSQPISLDRRFIPFTADAAAEDVRDVPLRLRSDEVAWDRVLEGRRVVILGEAGSGKTTELRQRAASLAVAGKAAFFLDVRELADHGLPAGLRAADAERFATWRASEQPGYFFFDSVDEALLNSRTFAGALRQLERGLYQDLGRAHVVFSCRVSDWQARADRAALERELLPPGAEQVVTTDVYELAPLGPAQIEALAAHYGVADPPAFRAAADNAGVAPFLVRPGDVERMVIYWHAHQAFGTLREMIEADLDGKLREHDPQRRSTLAPVRARAGALAAAGLAWLAGKSAFAVPDAALDPDRAAGCLDLAQVLTDLTPAELHDLLTLPLFDEATYGRVRIHHRSVWEYLTAQWLLELLAHGLPRPDVEGILFWEGPEGVIVPARWMAIAAWIAGTDLDVCRRLTDAEPTAFLRAGDPSSLSPESKRAIVDAIVARYRDRGRLPSVSDSGTLRRFAVGCPSDRVKAHLGSVESDGLKALLLEIARAGEMHDCVDAALRIANDVAGRRARREAIELVADIGSAAEVDKMLASLIDDKTSIDHDLGGALVGHCYPRWLTVDRLLELLERLDEPPPQTMTAIDQELGWRVLDKTPRGDRPRLLAGILALVQVRGEPRQLQRQWLVVSLARMLLPWAKDLGDAEISQLEQHLQFFSRLAFYGHVPHDLDGGNLGKLVEQDARVRRALFWWDVALARRGNTEGRPITDPWKLPPRERLWKLSGADAGWLADDARTKREVVDRLLAFNQLVVLPRRESEQGPSDDVMEALAAADDALGRRHHRILARRRPGPPDRLPVEREMVSHELRRVRREAEHRAALLARIDGIRAGTDTEALVFLEQHGLLASSEERGEQVSDTYGAEVTQAAREGLVRMWRSVHRRLRHESSGWSKVEQLAGRGLTLEIEAGLDFASLDEPTAELAARHAAAQLTGLPAWIVRLLAAHPKAVAKVLETCIDAEYGVGRDARHPYAVLSHLTHEPPEIRHLCRPLVFRLLLAGEPERVETLDDALQAIVAAAEPIDDLLPLAVIRFAAAGDDLARRATWWCAWLAADPMGATDALARDMVEAGPGADARMEAFAHRLLKFTEHVGDFPAPTDAAILGRLVEITFRHIRTEDDEPRLGVYSPGPRHNAESVRDWFVRALREAPGPGAYRELRRLAALPPCATWRDSLLADADARLRDLAADADAACATRVLRVYKTFGLGAVDHTVRMSGALASLRGLAAPLDEAQLLDYLCRLTSGDLDRVVATTGLDVSLLPPAPAPVCARAVEIMGLARSDSSLPGKLTAALVGLAP